MAQSNIIQRDSKYYADRVDRELAETLAIENYTTRQKFSLTCQYLGMEGHGSGIITQMTAKGDEDGTFWTMPFGFGFEDVDRVPSGGVTVPVRSVATLSGRSVSG
ncbi:MAG: L-fuculose-phosphate aldolase [Alphaproteobacteria bacterium]|jgi:L-fuculose-phosphate aldolase